MASVYMGPAFQLADRAAARQRDVRTASYRQRFDAHRWAWGTWYLVGGCAGHPESDVERGQWPQVLAWYACELAQLDCPWGAERDAAVYACSALTHDRRDAGCDWALGQLLLTPAAGFLQALDMV